jgi:uncharacterized protein (TIGR03437 family)
MGEEHRNCGRTRECTVGEATSIQPSFALFYQLGGNNSMTTSERSAGERACVHLLFSAAALLAAGQLVHAQQSILGSNLIANGNAEAGSAGTDATSVVASIPGWTRGSGNVNVVSYDTSGLIASTDPAPPDRNFQYFINGSKTATSTLTQNIDVSSGASTITAGNVKYTLSGYLGNAAGYNNSLAAAAVSAVFKDASGHTLNTATIGPIGYNGNGLFPQRQIGLVPPTTTQVAITLTVQTFDQQQYGAADSLSLVLTTLGTTPGSVLGTNLIVNGNAEAGPNVPAQRLTTYVPGWSTAGAFSVAPYGGTDWISATNPGPADRGVSLFCGGPPAKGSKDGYQDIDVSAAASLVDAGQVTYQISAWLGGVDVSGIPTLTYTFYDWTGKQLATTGQLSVTHTGTALAEASHADTLPAGTRRVHISLSFVAYYFIADDVSFILSAPSGPPVIDPGGVVNLTAFGGGATVAQGSWIEIYGRNLASTTTSWSGSDFVNGVGPTSLGGVSVSIGGAPAYVNYISPGQIDALLPSNAMTGPAPITITNANGTSDPYYVQVNQTLPSLLAPTMFTISGKQYAAAFNPDGSFALPANAIVGVTSNPATPGQTIVMYGIGFGPVSDGVTAGTLPTQQDSLTLPLVVNFGNTKATLAYAGLANGLTGLYQINVVVPQVPASSAEPITFTLGTAGGSQTLYIAVGTAPK